MKAGNTDTTGDTEDTEDIEDPDIFVDLTESDPDTAILYDLAALIIPFSSALKLYVFTILSSYMSSIITFLKRLQFILFKTV